MMSLASLTLALGMLHHRPDVASALGDFDASDQLEFADEDAWSLLCLLSRVLGGSFRLGQVWGSGAVTS